MPDYIPPGKPLYLTPDNIPVGRFCRTISIPDNPVWVGLVDGILSELTDPKKWRQYGSLTPEQAAAAWQEMLFESWEISGCAVTPAPYWDDGSAEDADDQEPQLDAPWYENLSDWAVTAFLATAFTPAAAIVYVSTIAKARLLFRARDYGAVVRVFIDGILQGEVDTYSPTPDVAYFDYDMTLPAPSGGGGGGPFAPQTYTIRIEHSGTANPAAVPTARGYGVEVIRKRLYESEVSELPPQMRVQDDVLQYSPDSGSSWIDLYDLDDLRGADGAPGPQGIQGIQGIQGPPGPKGDKGDAGDGTPPPDTSTNVDGEICGGVNYLVDYLESKLEDVLDVIDAGGSITAIVGGIVALGFPAAGLVAVFVSEGLEVGTSLIRASNTTEENESIRQMLYCAIKNSAGGFTQSVLTEWQTAINGRNNAWSSFMSRISMILGNGVTENLTQYFIGTLEPSNVCAAQWECDEYPDLILWETPNATLENLGGGRYRFTGALRPGQDRAVAFEDSQGRCFNVTQIHDQQNVSFRLLVYCDETFVIGGGSLVTGQYKRAALTNDINGANPVVEFTAVL